jgi:hypothetical protein
MNRYKVESVDPYDIELDKDGMFVMYDDANAELAASVAAERKRCAAIARRVADGCTDCDAHYIMEMIENA